ncbi:hypothetical protein [Roseibium sp. MMSF_3544]|uniref:hypothetical protein n=1 Tax=unclassified Roseibium TaxID=2629323 RepID=UPI00273E244A|nr:hypothetical protein [Roseibium sp. MMSF_3544]
MRLISTAIAGLALTAFAIVPASACSWGKTAKADTQMTVADTTIVPDVDTDVAIATNDLDTEVLQEEVILPVPEEAPTE